MTASTVTLIRKLDSITVLAEEDREALSALPLRIRDVASHEDFLHEGEPPQECCLLIEGFMYRYKLLPDGKRQILAFHTPGDIPDLQSFTLRVMDHSMATLTPCKVGFIQHDALRAVMRNYPAIGEAFWRDALIDGAIFRAWITSLGQRTARGHLAHLLCEVFVRLRAVGLTSEQGCDLPMTQVELADALGLTSVHVNRILQKLRGLGLITLTKNRLTILNWKDLAEVAQFDPAYLHLRKPDVAPQA